MCTVAAASPQSGHAVAAAKLETFAADGRWGGRHGACTAALIIVAATNCGSGRSGRAGRAVKGRGIIYVLYIAEAAGRAGKGRRRTEVVILVDVALRLVIRAWGTVVWWCLVIIAFFFIFCYLADFIGCLKCGR